MPAKVREQGRYELFETNHHHRILVLNDRECYAWVQGQRGEILVRSDSDHVKDHTISQGEFYLVDFENDPKYRDVPHLFLQQDGQFQEYMVPNGLPTEHDMQKLVVKTDETLPKDKLEGYLKHPASAGSGEVHLGISGGGSMAHVTHHLKGIDFPADREKLLSYARDQDAPRPVMEKLEALSSRKQFQSMAEVTRAVGEQD